MASGMLCSRTGPGPTKQMWFALGTRVLSEVGDVGASLGDQRFGALRPKIRL
jgi:hypothetical protein